jgi:hypothetical protein
MSVNRQNKPARNKSPGRLNAYSPPPRPRPTDSSLAKPIEPS